MYFDLMKYLAIYHVTVVPYALMETAYGSISPPIGPY